MFEHDETLAEARERNVRDALFEDIGRTLIRPGVLESQISREIFDLAAAKHNTTKHWHKRVVRAGPNTLQPYARSGVLPLTLKIPILERLFEMIH